MEIDGIEVRDAGPEDAAAIVRVHDLAFGRTNESRLVEAIRRSGASVISMVATMGARVVGHVLFSPVTIDAPGVPIAAMGLAPLAVLPDVQRGGIGTMLVTLGLDEARRRRVKVIIVLGEPAYYQRFGFRPAREFGMRLEYPEAGDAFMVRELANGVLAGRAGLARYLPEFADV